MTITANQNKLLHALLSSTGQASQKSNLVYGFTDGRTESSREMLATEAEQLIQYLKLQDNSAESANVMRRKIISMCHRIKWQKDGKADMQRLNTWCIESGYLKKPLNDYTQKELPKLVSQFTQVYKSYLKSV